MDRPVENQVIGFVVCYKDSNELITRKIYKSANMAIATWSPSNYCQSAAATPYEKRAARHKHFYTHYILRSVLLGEAT